MSAFLRSTSLAATVRTTARAFSSTTPRPLARITIIGNLTAPPELRPSQSGLDYLRYAVASNSGSGENRHASFFNVTSFVQEGGQRDFLLSLPKGTLVCVEGEASQSNYTDAEGKPRKGLSIVQRHLEVLRRPSGERELPPQE